MLPLWTLIVLGAIFLQAAVGGVLAAIGSAMMGRQRWAARGEPRSLAQKLASAGAILLVIAAVEFGGLIVAYLWWASGERFA